jgi:hypothetical protein
MKNNNRNTNTISYTQGLIVTKTHDVPKQTAQSFLDKFERQKTGDHNNESKTKNMTNYILL